MARSTSSRSSGSSIAAAISAAFRRPSGLTEGGSCAGAGAGAAAGSGSGPGTNLSGGRSGSRPRISLARLWSSKAQIASLQWTISVPSRWKRAGCALRAISAPTAGSQAASRSPMAAFGPSRPSSCRTSSPSGSIVHLPGSHFEQLVGLGRKHRGIRRRHERLAGARHPRGENAAAAGVELGEDIVEQQKRRDPAALGEQLRFGEQQREHGETLLALRSEDAEVAAAGADEDVVQVRSGARDPTIEVSLEPLFELRRGRGLALVAEPGSVETELAGALRERGCEQRKRLSSSRDECGSELRHLLGPRSHRGPCRRSGRGAAERGVPLRDRSAVVRRKLGACGCEAGEDAVEVRTPRGRRTLDDAEPVGREDERDGLCAKLLRSAKTGPVQGRGLAGTGLEGDLDVDRHRTASAVDADSRAALAETNELRVAARPGRKALRAHVERLEEVRLADSVRTHGEHEAGTKLQREPLVRPERCEMNRLDDQLAGQADRHHEVCEVVALALQDRRPQRADQLQPHVVAVHRLEAVAEEVGVEADLERLSGEAGRHRFLRLAYIVRTRDHRQLAGGEAQLERRRPLDHHRGATDDLEQFASRQRQLVLELLGKQLAVVRELPVDAARRQPDTIGGEDDLVLVHADLDAVAGRGYPRELLKRARRHDRLELGSGTRELGLLDGEPVRIGRRHDELAAAERDEDAGENGPGFVARSGARDTLDRLEQGLPVDAERL